MRRAVLLLATMALAVLLASGVAQAIINGEPDIGEDAHPYVGALVTEFEVAEGETELLPLCSGTLISPTVFLTAGHCTDYLIEEGLPTYVSFDPTYEPGKSELVSGTPTPTRSSA
jgi:secreted trypsin-like serine protease